MTEYVAVDILNRTCGHFDLRGLRAQFGLEENEIAQLVRGGLILPDQRVELIKKEWLRLSDPTRIQKMLYGHLVEGYDVLTVGHLRSLTMLIAYVNTFDVPFPPDFADVKCFVVGHVDLYKPFEVKYYYVVGKTDG